MRLLLLRHQKCIISNQTKRIFPCLQAFFLFIIVFPGLNWRRTPLRWVNKIFSGTFTSDFFSSVFFVLFDIVENAVSTKGIIWGTYGVVANLSYFNIANSTVVFNKIMSPGVMQRAKRLDKLRFLGNCTPTPPLSQHLLLTRGKTLP